MNRRTMRTWVIAALAVILLTAPPVAAGVFEAKLQPDGLGGQDFLGYAVAISGDTVVVGARGDDDGGSVAGAAYVYVRNGSAWESQAKLLADDAVTGLTFGSAVGIDGDTIVVGAPEQGSFGAGSAYVFVRSGTSWTQQDKLVPSVPASTGSFGASVGIDGETVVVGAPHPQNLIPQLGDAYVFVREETSWSEQARLLAGDGVPGDWFGTNVGVSGDRVIVGASKDDDNGTDSGSAYVFVRNGVLWTQEDKLLAPDGGGLDRFGASVRIDGDTAAVGAWSDDDVASGAGAAYVFTRSGVSWLPQDKLTTTGGLAGDTFGGSLALAGDALVIGANLADTDFTDAGAAYLFERSGSSWSETLRLTASDAGDDDSYGYSVALDGDTAVVGANLHDGASTQSGAAYVYRSLLSPWENLGFALAGAAGEPLLVGNGALLGGDPAAVDLSGAAPNATCGLFIALESTPVPFKGGTLGAFPFVVLAFLTTDGTGAIPIPFTWPVGLPTGATLVFQYAIVDAGAVFGVALSNTAEAVTP